MNATMLGLLAETPIHPRARSLKYHENQWIL